MLESIKTHNCEQIITLFNQHKSWEDKYRQLLQLAKQLPLMDLDHQTDRYLVRGCESDVWLYQQKNTDDNSYHFSGYSNARIVKGLLVIIFAAYQDSTIEQIKAFDIEEYFAKLDLIKHLSPSRANGIYAVIEQIKQAN